MNLKFNQQLVGVLILRKPASRLCHFLTHAKEYGTGVHESLKWEKAPAENVGDAGETADSSPSRPLWFDYPDSDQKKILAIYQYIGEQPEFVAPSNFPRLLRYILIGSVILILLFFLYQIISKMIFKRSTT